MPVTSILLQLTELSTERIVLNPKNYRVEFANTCWTSKDPACDSPEIADAVQAHLIQVSDAWFKQARIQYPSVGHATFYAWYDEQAGQLRMSMTSNPPDQLPFGCTVVLNDTPEKIVHRMLRDGSPGLIAWSELEVVDPDDLPPQQEGESFLKYLSRVDQPIVEYRLDVWAVTHTW